MEDVSYKQINDPEVNMMVNTSNKPNEVLEKDSATGNSVIHAPGEDKTPSNIMREYILDAKAFPFKHPSGKYGLNFKRVNRLYKKQYFSVPLQWNIC